MRAKNKIQRTTLNLKNKIKQIINNRIKQIQMTVISIIFMNNNKKA